NLLPPDLSLEHVFEAVLDLLVCLVHFLVGQRAVVRLIGQGERQALLALGNAAAAVQVEEADLAQQVAAAGADLGDEALRGHALAPPADESPQNSGRRRPVRTSASRRGSSGSLWSGRGKYTGPTSKRRTPSV